jgi:hypothetical protein
MSMHDERDWGTLARLLVAPGGFTRILLGKLGARFVVGVAQMALLLGWGTGSSASARLVAVGLPRAHDRGGLRGRRGRDAGRRHRTDA